MPFVPTHLNALKDAIRLDAQTGVGPQGAEGMSALTWATGVGYRPLRGALSDAKLDRIQVRDYCRSPDNTAEHCFITVMAWGGGGLKAHYRRSSWEARQRWRNVVASLRQSGTSRSNAYEALWSLKNRDPDQGDDLPGVGPAFFTKLIFFMRDRPNGFIMDQWLGKSVNLVTGERIVRMDGDCASLRNTSADYERFCGVVEELGGRLGLNHDAIEQALFSRGGRRPGPWRRYVKEHWSGTIGRGIRFDGRSSGR